MLQIIKKNFILNVFIVIFLNVFFTNGILKVNAGEYIPNVFKTNIEFFDNIDNFFSKYNSYTEMYNFIKNNNLENYICFTNNKTTSYRSVQGCVELTKEIKKIEYKNYRYYDGYNRANIYYTFSNNSDKYLHRMTYNKDYNSFNYNTIAPNFVYSHSISTKNDINFNQDWFMNSAIIVKGNYPIVFTEGENTAYFKTLQLGEAKEENWYNFNDNFNPFYKKAISNDFSSININSLSTKFSANTIDKKLIFEYDFLDTNFNLMQIFPKVLRKKTDGDIIFFEELENHNFIFKVYYEPGIIMKKRMIFELEGDFIDDEELYFYLSLFFYDNFFTNLITVSENFYISDLGEFQFNLNDINFNQDYTLLYDSSNKLEHYFFITLNSKNKMVYDNNLYNPITNFLLYKSTYRYVFDIPKSNIVIFNNITNDEFLGMNFNDIKFLKFRNCFYNDNFDIYDDEGYIITSISVSDTDIIEGGFIDSDDFFNKSDVAEFIERIWSSIPIILKSFIISLLSMYLFLIIIRFSLK